MAANDIMPWTSHMGGHVRVVHFPMTGAQVFQEGEPVELVAAGSLTEGTTPVIVGQGFFGIAAQRATTVRDGTVALTALTPVGVYDPAGVYFITRNFTIAGAALEVPLAAHIGDGFGLILLAGVWFVNLAAATNIGRIIAVLDANKRPVGTTGAGAGVFVVVQFLVGQSMGAGGTVDTVDDAN